MATLATETWTGTDGASWPSQWTALNQNNGAGGGFDIFGNQGRITMGSSQYTTAGTAYLTNVSSVNMDATFDFTWSNTNENYLYIILRATGIPNRQGSGGGTGYVFSVISSVGGNGGLDILRMTNGTSTSLGEGFHGGLTAGTTYTIRAQAIGSALRMKLWAKSDSEPGTWGATATNSTITAAGAFVIQHYTGASNSVSYAHTIDNLTLTDGVSTQSSSGSAATSGSGTLTNSGSPNHRGTRALTGSGTLANSGRPAFTGASFFSGAGTVGGTAPTYASDTFPASGSGTLAASGMIPVPASLSGGSSLGLYGRIQYNGTEAATGEGFLSGLLTAAGLSGSSPLAGDGLLQTRGRRGTILDAAANRFLGDDIAGAEGDKVSSWKSRTSATTLTQDTVSAQPTKLLAGRNGKSALRLNGSSVSLGSASTRPSSTTISVVLHPFFLAGDRAIFKWGSFTVGAYDTGAYYYANTGSYPSAGTLNTDGPQILTFNFTPSGTVDTAFLNGTQVTSADLGALDSDSTALRLGASGSDYSLDSAVYEVLTWDRILTAAERKFVHTYASQTYGMSVSDYDATQVVERYVELSGSGTQTRAGNPGHKGSASVSGGSALGLVGIVPVPGSVSLSGASSLSATRAVIGSLALGGEGLTTCVEAALIFRTPTVTERSAGRGFGRFIKVDRGRTLVYVNKRFVMTDDPSDEMLAAADKVWLGGRDYVLARDAVVALRAAGYGANFTPAPGVAVPDNDGIYALETTTPVTPVNPGDSTTNPTPVENPVFSNQVRLSGLGTLALNGKSAVNTPPQNYSVTVNRTGSGALGLSGSKGSDGAASNPSGFTIPTANYTNSYGTFTLARSTDFNQNAALGTFPYSSSYSSDWDAYDGFADTYGQAIYRPAQTMWVANGCLNQRMFTSGGEAKAVQAGFRSVSGSAYSGQLYGRFECAMRAVWNGGNYNTNGYKWGIAYLLWPVSDQWPADGEIDWPETDVQPGSWPSAYMHYANASGGQDNFETNRGKTITDWHKYAIEWSPGRVEFFLDGVSHGVSTTQVPSKAMRWSLQAGATVQGTPPDADLDVTLQVDWAAIWTRS